ncbi:O-antigen ligase family protein [Leptospira kirschneri]|uniref:O-antigen ligase family protein n=2 Tax=Leptospira kirschneri TaxID=29507 RepID=UPI0003478C90|nr:ligase [Leptospira kirschneri]KON76858.1 O-antigen ligase-like membrane protein [Leptospira kirschneri serovar Mozdok]KPZ77020.1 ligase [Leptospira kirschneri serovar Mozdok]
MKDRVRKLLPFKSLIWIFFGILLILPLLAFYPWKYRIVFVFLFVCFTILDLLFPLVATFFLTASGVFFGNHPGGRFLELQDCLWIYWCVRGIIENKLYGNRILEDPFWKSTIGVLLLSFFGIGILSLIANPELFLDFKYYQKGWFWFLHSTELEPYYPIKLLFLGILFLFGLIARKNWLGKSSETNSFYLVFASGVGFGMIVSIGFGWIEYFSPILKWKLNYYHRWLDGYKFLALPHPLIPGLKRYLPRFGIQSLFWNRSWFAVYLVSGLPFLFYWILNVSKNSKIRIFKNNKLVEEGSSEKIPLYVWVLFFTVLLVLGAVFFLIGARGGMFSFLTFCIFTVFIFFFLLIKNKNISRVLTPVFISHFVLAGILFPIWVVWTLVGPMDPERFSHFSSGMKLGIEKLLLGGGFESYGWYNECCLSSDIRASTYHTTHNQYLQIFSGLGMMGVVLYSLLWCFLFYELLKSERRGRSTLVVSVLFSSVAAVFVYSFFQEWFYLRSVYFQWIALFPLFWKEKLGSGFLIRTNSFLNLRNILFSLCLILILLFGSWIFFPTKKFRFGIYFPPGEKENSGWVLEGNGKMTLYSKAETYFLNMDKKLGDVSISIWGRFQREIFPVETEDSNGNSLFFRASRGRNILKTECILIRKTEPLATLNFWNPIPLDPEPRKLCSQIRIRKIVRRMN